MNNRYNNGEEMLARLIGEAGDPNVVPDRKYAESLRATILDRASANEGKGIRGQGSETPNPQISKSPNTHNQPSRTVLEEGICVFSTPSVERAGKMRRFVRFAVATTILVVLAISVSYLKIGGGAAGIAFANVAEALDKLRSATFNVTAEVNDSASGKNIHMKSKGFFLAPALQRMESSVEDNVNGNSTMIMDMEAGKAIMLMTAAKIAVVVDAEQMKHELDKSTGRPQPNIFEMVRRLVREGSSGLGEEVELLGTKDIDGREAVGFRTRPTNAQEFTLWADPQTALPIRVEIITTVMGEVKMVMGDFNFDVELDPSLFSLEPPEGYTVQAMNYTMPVEEDLVKVLRIIAEHNNGDFPATIGMNKEYMQAMQTLMKPEMDKLEAKYGVKPKPGESPPPAMMAEAMKTIMPLAQKQMQGIMFYMALKPENDSHYAGKGGKLDTPDRPIFWYKPTGAEIYHVIYADLSVKEMSAEEVKQLPAAGEK